MSIRVSIIAVRKSSVEFCPLPDHFMKRVHASPGLHGRFSKEIPVVCFELIPDVSWESVLHESLMDPIIESVTVGGRSKIMVSMVKETIDPFSVEFHLPGSPLLESLSRCSMGRVIKVARHGPWSTVSPWVCPIVGSFKGHFSCCSFHLGSLPSVGPCWLPRSCEVVCKGHPSSPTWLVGSAFVKERNDCLAISSYYKLLLIKIINLEGFHGIHNCENFSVDDGSPSIHASVCFKDYAAVLGGDLLKDMLLELDFVLMDFHSQKFHTVDPNFHLCWAQNKPMLSRDLGLMRLALSNPPIWFWKNTLVAGVTCFNGGSCMISFATSALNLGKTMVLSSFTAPMVAATVDLSCVSIVDTLRSADDDDPTYSWLIMVTVSRGDSGVRSLHGRHLFLCPHWKHLPVPLSVASSGFQPAVEARLSAAPGAYWHQSGLRFCQFVAVGLRQFDQGMGKPILELLAGPLFPDESLSKCRRPLISTLGNGFLPSSQCDIRTRGKYRFLELQSPDDLAIDVGKLAGVAS
nr:hypothetical protein Iba_scaffold6551CG0020 [Ipomoea batatas]